MGAVITPPAALPIPGVTNWDPLLSPKARAAIANVRLGRGRARIATLGDSTWAGIGAGTGGDHNLQGARQAAVPWVMAGILNGRGLPTIPDAVFSCGAVPAPTIYNPNVSQGSGWVLSTQNTAGGTLWQNGTTTGTTLSVTTTTPCNAFDVYYCAVNTAQFTLQIDSETPVVVNVTSAGAALLKATVSSATEGVHTLKIVRTGASGNVFIGMIDPYSSINPRVSIWNMGIGGSQTSTWINASASWSPLNALTTYAPDLTIINLGINDEGAGVLIPTFMSQEQTIINAGKQSGDVWLIMHHACSGHEAQEPGTYAALQQLAANNNIPLIDFRARLGQWTAANANGQMYDFLHATGLGYADEAAMVADLVARL